MRHAPFPSKLPLLLLGRSRRTEGVRGIRRMSQARRLYLTASSAPDVASPALYIGSSARELALVDDQILSADGLAGEVAIQYLARSRRVPPLCGQRRSRDVRGHAMLRHGPPWMVLGSGLREPDITRVPGKPPSFERPHDGIPISLRVRRLRHNRHASSWRPACRRRAARSRDAMEL